MIIMGALVARLLYMIHICHASNCTFHFKVPGLTTLFKWCIKYKTATIDSENHSNGQDKTNKQKKPPCTVYQNRSVLYSVTFYKKIALFVKFSSSIIKKIQIFQLYHFSSEYGELKNAVYVVYTLFMQFHAAFLIKTLMLTNLENEVNFHFMPT